MKLYLIYNGLIIFFRKNDMTLSLKKS